MEIILNPGDAGAADGSGGGDLIKDSDTENFAADVIDMSAKVPVIVDFWAPWCGPCKTLGPSLEKVVRHAAGLVRLVKINIDENQQLATQLRVQSIPTVYAFKDGRPVDAFQGAVPESEVKRFVDRLTDGAKPPLDEAIDQAGAALAAGDVEAALGVYSQVLEQEPENAAAAAGIIRCAIALGDAAQARQMIDGMPDAVRATPEVAAAIAALDLAEEGETPADVTALQARLAADENDHQARFDLAVALYGGDDPDAAIEQLLELVRRDREWNEEAARLQLVKIFDALGPTHPSTVAGRRGLSTILFS
jgi:putative thioredoxin